MPVDPFSRGTFAQTWARHFSPEKQPRAFGFISPLLFYKSSVLPIYINAGRNLTKGSAYSFSDDPERSFRKKTFLIYDVADHLQPETGTLPHGLRRYRVSQYPGFLIDLRNTDSLEAFMRQQFSKSSRYKLQKYRKKLESSFDIRYVMYRGELAETSYHQLFDSFRALLEKRFADKQVSNNNLDPAEWEFYKEVAYPMIRGKKAGLFVIYNGDQPIAITLNYFWDAMMIDAITVFDTAYAKFHPGSVNIMALLDWCLEQEIRIFDFSKGYFDYKQRWATREYRFEYHILFDGKSVRACLLAAGLRAFFTVKQWLRDKNVNETLHRLTYRFRSGGNPSPPATAPYSLVEADIDFNSEDWILVDRNTVAFQRLQPGRFDFLYLSMERESDLQVYSSKKEAGLYFLKGKQKSMLLRVTLET